jgi:hypothetical protein
LIISVLLVLWILGVLPNETWGNVCGKNCIALCLSICCSKGKAKASVAQYLKKGIFLG